MGSRGVQRDKNKVYFYAQLIPLLKVLLIPAFRLYPVDSGGAHAQLVFLEQQQELDIDLFVTPENIPEKELEAFRKRFPHVRLILSGYGKEGSARKSAGFIRKTLRKLSGRDHAYRTRKFGLLNGLVLTRPEAVDEILRITREKVYDVIQTEHTVNMGLVELLPPGPLKIFVHHEIAFTRIESDLLSQGYSQGYAAYFSSVARHLETGWLNRYDGIITLNAGDAATLRSAGVDVPMQVTRAFILFREELQAVYQPGPAPSLLFVGGESHYPNKEGLSWFLKEVYPGVRSRNSQATIRITGHWSQEYQDKHKADPSIVFTGFLPDLEALYTDSILITPIRIGSGIRIKVLTALAKAVPVVGTTLGVSGIPGLVHGENVLIADDAAGFAEQTLRLLEQETLRRQISENGFALASKGYNEGSLGGERTRFYRSLMGKD